MLYKAVYYLHNSLIIIITIKQIHKKKQKSLFEQQNKYTNQCFIPPGGTKCYQGT